VNEECLKTELDLLKELRAKERIREEAFKSRTTRIYNANVASRAFNKNMLL